MCYQDRLLSHLGASGALFAPEEEACERYHWPEHTMQFETHRLANRHTDTGFTPMGSNFGRWEWRATPSLDQENHGRRQAQAILRTDRRRNAIEADPAPGSPDNIRGPDAPVLDADS